jgi:hypothetical protein
MSKFKSGVSKSKSRSKVEPLEFRLLLSTTQIFTIDSALSTATGGGSLTYASSVDANGTATGSFITAPFQPLYSGSFTNNSIGTITVQTTANSIQFVNANIAGENTSGTSETAGIPVNFGGSCPFDQQTPSGADIGTLYTFVNGLDVSLSSGPLTLTNGSFYNTGETFGIVTGALGIHSVGTADGQPASLGPTYAELSGFATGYANTSTQTSTLVVNGNGDETLTIYATGSISDTIGDLTATLHLSDQIVATYTPPTSPAVTAAVANGVLTVQGTPNNDYIQINQSGSTITVLSSGASIGTFDASGLTQIDLNGNAGADVLKVGPSVNVPAVVSGSTGADTIIASNGNDTLEGGPGFDSIVTLAGDDVVFGGMGGDSLASSAANDTLGGGKGLDSIASLYGNDSLIGGMGNDTLLSGNGLGDSLDGGAGTNVIVQNTLSSSSAVATSGDVVVSNHADTAVSDDTAGAIAPAASTSLGAAGSANLWSDLTVGDSLLG